MRRAWSWSAASLLAVSLLALSSSPARAATVLERTVRIEIRPDGRVSERDTLRVRLDNDHDLASWSPYPIYLDENRTLESLSASVTRPDGRTETVARRAIDTREVTATGELHSSRKLRTVAFPLSPVGSVLALDYEVRERPWFSAGLVGLGSSDPVESLRVEVTGGGAGWRSRIAGSPSGLEVKESPGGIVITGAHLPRLSPPELAPDEASSGALLLYAWGDERDWAGVGHWYDRLVADVPLATEPVRARARELTAGISGRREKLEALVAFVRRQVRYVAVEVGIGGYRPGAPAEVLGRGWGDCKDKAFLLVSLLRDAGIDAWPVLVRLDENGRVERDFPSPLQFNHAIAAVSAEGLDLPPDAPVADGLLFLDATQRNGGLAWLNPGVQGQEALVVRGGRGELVRIPVRPAAESRRMTVDLTVDAAGQATGNARLELSGEAGESFLDRVGSSRPEEVEREAREWLTGYLPASAIGEPKWTTSEAGVPSAVLTARVRLDTLPEAGAFPVNLAPRAWMPAPGLLDARAVPVVTAPFSNRVTWWVTLPRACPPAPGQDVTVENPVGSFHQTFSLDGGKLVLERSTELRSRWIDPESFAALKEVSLAEYRAIRRRLRLACPGS
jgi:hypothetical protein